MNHTIEPWKLRTGLDAPRFLKTVALIYGKEGAPLGELYNVHNDTSIDLANAERIVACVNALAGIEDPEGFVLRAVAGGLPFGCDFVTPATLLVHHPDGSSQQMIFAAGDVLNFGQCEVLTEVASVAKLQRELESAREAAQSNWTRVCELERKVTAYEELYGAKP